MKLYLGDTEIADLSESTVRQINKEGCTLSGSYNFDGGDWMEFGFMLSNVKRLELCLDIMKHSVHNVTDICLTVGKKL